MATKIHGKTEKFGVIRQNPASAAATAFMAIGNTSNQWTNPGLPETNYRTLYLTPGTAIPDPNVSVDDYNLTSQAGLNKEYYNKFVNSVSGLKRIPFSAIADRYGLAPLLIGNMQAVAEAATTPFQKTITCGFVAGTIDFNGGSGYLHSYAGNQRASADDGWILENALTESITLTWNFLQPGKGKLVMVSGNLVGNEFNPEQTLSGTWVVTSIAPFNNTDTWSFNTFTVDGVDWSTQCIKSISLTMNLNVTSNCATSAGKPNQYDVSPSRVWTINLDHNSTTEKLVGDYMAGANVDIDFGNSIGTGVAGHFRVDMPYGQITSNPPGYDNGYKSYTLTVEALQNATESPVTIYFADALDWGY